MSNAKIRFTFELIAPQYMIEKIIQTLSENYWVKKCNAEISHEIIETPPPGFKFVEADDDIYTIEEFRRCVESGAFIDYDGSGVLSDGKIKKTSGYSTSDFMSVTDLVNNDDQRWTHVVWYNK